MLNPPVEESGSRLQNQAINRIVLERLRQAILDGTLKPGARLRQEELAAQLGVSSIPVREALQTLAAERLVTLRPRRGAIVAKLDAKEIQEVHELRAVLEGFTTEIATARISSDDLAGLDVILQQMAGLSGRGEERPVWLALNRDFHFTLYRAAAKPFFLREIEKHFQHSMRLMNIYLDLAATLEPLHLEHQAIYSAVQRRDPAQAGRMMYRHILESGLRLIAYLDDQAADPADDKTNYQEGYVQADGS